MVIMGVSEKLHQMDGGGGGAVGSEKWVVGGIELPTPLKPLFTKPTSDGEEENGHNSTTPTRAESRIPARLPCPPPPKKRKAAAAAASRCHCGRVGEFFCPPDLETIFIRRVEGA